MTGTDDGADTADDAAAMVRHAKALADAVEAALPGWVERSVRTIAARQAVAIDPDGWRAVHAAGSQARDNIGGRVRDLLALDVDEQPTGPLALLRDAVRYPTSVLRDMGVAPVLRDEFAAGAFPGDIFDLAPASFSDIDPALAEPGLVWGAAKAHVVLARRRREGRR